MQAAFHELPLAVFTTLGPIGAGAFVALAVALVAGSLTDAQLERLDKRMIVPTAVAIAGFGASVAHLGDAGHMLGAVAGVGRSPLSNEICVGGAFVAVALVYSVMGLTGKLGGGARRGLGIAAGAVGLVFAVFTGLAYYVPTIQSWASPLTVLQVVGFALAGGAAFLPALAGAGEGGAKSRPIASVLAVIGAITAVIGLGGMAASVSGMSTYVASGAALVSGAALYLACGLALVAASAACTWVAERKGASGVAWAAVALAVVGVFLCRLAFYGMQLSVGLSL